jgi:tRNA1(Val) A37 N6-methylase TrmN6
MTANEIEPKTLRLVCKTEGTEPWLVLIEGRLKGGKGMRILPNLNIYGKDGGLSKEMTEIYGPYKLK